MGSAKDLGVEVDTVMVFICGERVMPQLDHIKAFKMLPVRNGQTSDSNLSWKGEASQLWECLFLMLSSMIMNAFRPWKDLAEFDLDYVKTDRFPHCGLLFGTGIVLGQELFVCMFRDKPLLIEREILRSISRQHYR